MSSTVKFYVTIKHTVYTQHFSQPKKSYMFRLYESAIIRLHISEIWTGHNAAAALVNSKNVRSTCMN